MNNLKKLGKLNLSSKKLLNREELVNFRGGSDAGCGSGCVTCECLCTGTTGCVEDNILAVIAWSDANCPGCGTQCG